MDIISHTAILCTLDIYCSSVWSLRSCVRITSPVFLGVALIKLALWWFNLLPHREETHFALCEKTGSEIAHRLSGFVASAENSVPSVMCVFACVCCFSPFFSALQFHLVCHDQQAQHPVPLRHITPDPATLCSQGATRVNFLFHFCGGNSCFRFFLSWLYESVCVMILAKSQYNHMYHTDSVWCIS